jgi:hypothetical protein
MADDGTPRRPDREFVVDAVPARPPRRSRSAATLVAVAAIVVVGLTAWGVVVAPGPGPSVPASAVPVAPSGSVDASMTLTASGVAGSPSPSVAPGPTLPVPADRGGALPSADAPTEAVAFAALAASGGWRQCPMWRPFSDGTRVNADAVLDVLARDPGVSGMLGVLDSAGGERQVWVGGTAEDAARGFGGSAVVTVGDDVWTTTPDDLGYRAIRLEPILLVDVGRYAYQVTATAWPATYCMVDSFGGPPARAVVANGPSDPFNQFATESGWSDCRTWQRLVLEPTPDAAAVDAGASAMGPGDTGWATVVMPGGASDRTEPVWIGDDPADAGARHGSSLVVINSLAPRRAWMASTLDGAPFAVAFDVITTPAGRTAWVPTADAAGVVAECERVRPTGSLPSPSP